MGDPGPRISNHNRELLYRTIAKTAACLALNEGPGETRGDQGYERDGGEWNLNAWMILGDVDGTGAVAG